MVTRTSIAALLALALASSAFAATPTLRQQEEAAKALYPRLTLELGRTGDKILKDADGLAKLSTGDYTTAISKLQRLIDMDSDPLTPGKSFLSTQTLGTLGQITTELTTYKGKQQEQFQSSLTSNQESLAALFRPTGEKPTADENARYEKVQGLLKTMADPKATQEARANALKAFSEEFKGLPGDEKCNWEGTLQDLQGNLDEIAATDRALTKVEKTTKERAEAVDKADRAAGLKEEAKNAPPGSGPGSGPGGGSGGGSSSPSPSPSPSPLAGGGGGGGASGGGGSGGGSGGPDIGQVDLPNPSDFLSKENDGIRGIVEALSGSNSDDFMPAIQKLIQAGANFATGNGGTAAINLGQAFGALPGFDQYRAAAAQALAQPVVQPVQSRPPTTTTTRVLTAAVSGPGATPAPRTTRRPQGAPAANQVVLRLNDGRRVVGGAPTNAAALHLTTKGLLSVREDARYLMGPLDPQLLAELERAGDLISGTDRNRALTQARPSAGRALAGPRALTSHATRRAIKTPLGNGTHSK